MRRSILQDLEQTAVTTGDVSGNTLSDIEKDGLPDRRPHRFWEGREGMSTDDIDRHSSRGHYSIAMLAPPWAPITSQSRDVERAIGLLCSGLVERGHRVTLFAAPGTKCSATVHEIPQPHGVREVGSVPFEIDYVARFFERFRQGAEQGRPFDIVHDHCGLSVVAMADWIPMPVVHTMHWSFSRKIGDIYAQYADRAHLVATNEAQVATVPPNMRLAGMVPDPVDLRDWPLQPSKQNYLLWSWRFEPLHGAHEVISAARAARVPLIVSGPVRRDQERWFGTEIAPYLDNDQVRYVGEVSDDRRRELITDARGLLVPAGVSDAYRIDVVHALAAGTPVIASEGGAAAEILQPGVNGYLASGEEALTAAIAALDKLDPRDCRESAAKRHGLDAAVASYETIYHRVAGHRERRRSQVTWRDSRSELIFSAQHRRPRRYRIGR
jgi:glycosyltransferase involved in cell wall biosynthesis